MQYATTAAFAPGKTPVTISTHPAATTTTAQSIVHGIHAQQTQAHHQQIVHQKSAHQSVTYGAPGIAGAGGRQAAVAAASLPTMPNPAVTLSAAGAAPNPLPAAPAGAGGAAPAAGGGAATTGSQGSMQFQRLKVEDALSYLDQVRNCSLFFTFHCAGPQINLQSQI